MLVEFVTLETDNPRGFRRVTQLTAHLMRSQFVQLGMGWRSSTRPSARWTAPTSATDSKALERNVRQVASAIARLFPTDGSHTGSNPDELLAGVGIVRLPQPVLIRGSLALKGQAIPELPFIGFPTECAELVYLRRRPSYVLTIENYASFVRNVREVSRTDEGLVIYSGGFPSRPTLQAIAGLAAQADAPTFHWGDMDAGGVRIFRHIERHLAPLGVSLRPHMMNADLLRRAGTVVADTPDVVVDMTGSTISELARVIRETGLVHEQEEFSPRSPVGEDSTTRNADDAGASPMTTGASVA